jgi:REP element-mobilizing transposase RayT
MATLKNYNRCMLGDDSSRRKPNRLHGYDYSQAGAYFITIVTEQRQCLFGSVLDHDMKLNEAGLMVQNAWKALEHRFPTIEAGSFVLMPNHVHGVVILQDQVDVGAGLVPALSPRATTRVAPTLGQIVGALKSITTLHYARGVRELGWVAFQRRLWQRSYYDHIIRTAEEWKRVHDYIISNAAQWALDSENPKRSEG